jgi:hypothetical protein
MIIAICILSGLLVCTILIIACLIFAIDKIIDDVLENNPKLVMDYYFDKESVEKYKCTLLLTENENAEFDGSIYDFSQYEEKNIIGLIECKKGTAINDIEPRFALLPNQTVLRMKDGSYQWDFRGFI